MSDKIFLDTNILVYLYDAGEPVKQSKALQVVDELVRSRQAVISPQVLGEFFVATTRPSRPLLTIAEAQGRITSFYAALTVVDLTGFITLEAVRGVVDHQMSFWDAQIWAAARLNQISTVYSEDFSTGAVIEGVRFTNPLLE
jgi:predicted nucleic acid-binding protein